MPKTQERTRVAKRQRGGPPPDNILRPCGHCGIEHHRFAACADRVHRGRGKRAESPPPADPNAEPPPTIPDNTPGVPDDPEPVMSEAQRVALLERRNEVETGEDPAELRDTLKAIVSTEVREEVLGATVGETGMTVAEIKEHKLITDPAEIEALTPDALRRELRVRAELDRAETDHEKREKELGFKIARPEILRRPSEKAGKILLNQLEHTLAVAGVTARVAANPTPENLKRSIPEEEAQLTHDILGKIPEMREQKRQEAARKAELTSHINGDVPWVCESDPDAECYARVFYAASIEVVRKKAAAEPGWTFACPRCRGIRVRLADQREGVAA